MKSALGTRRTALVLYGVLLVLPTLVLGGLHWRQLELDHQDRLQSVPLDASNAAQRLSQALQRRVFELLDAENKRPFFHYRREFHAPGTKGHAPSFVQSPLTRGDVAPRSIEGWFSYRDGKGIIEPTILLGSHEDDEDAEARRVDIEAIALQYEQEYTEPLFDFDWDRVLGMRFKTEEYALPVFALNLSTVTDIDCITEEYPALKSLDQLKRSARVSYLGLRIVRDARGRPHVLASRTVYVERDPEAGQLPSCFVALNSSAVLHQGFLIDPKWIFDELPEALAQQVLVRTQRLVPRSEAPPATLNDIESFPIDPLPLLMIDASAPEDQELGAMNVVVNTSDLEQRFRKQMARFFGVAAMLVLSLATGILLLVRSVNRDLEAARRTENFVAAVTHELRTPLAAIKLYGEMLHDGWVEDPKKREEYYRRIVRETARLETLVERVLEKAQISSRTVKPEPGDVNDVLESMSSALLAVGRDGPDGPSDLVFEYGDGLPKVNLVSEAVRSIVTNLVENARKYAPVKAGGEPILVKSHCLAEQVVLDVLDRGPGIPHSERSRIFEAFYRVGNETTRTARGTGLGLHLVAVQAQSMNARVAVLDRKGGGTVFRITLQTAEKAGPTAT